MPDATERRLKDLSDKDRLVDYAIVHFATHGALTGQLTGWSEPGLILTPPAKGTTDPQLLKRDDGYVTASEIATLKFNADWVILSACYTGGSGGESAEALSGSVMDEYRSRTGRQGNAMIAHASSGAEIRQPVTPST